MSHDSNGFDDSYRGTPPWDIGRPQREFVKLEQNGEISGSVLDVGCGTGENALYFAQTGHKVVVGVDFSPRAIRRAREKARERKIKNVSFRVEDALQLSKLAKEVKFDNAIDCGLFHTFADQDRAVFARNLRDVLNQKGKYFMLCFSDLEPMEWGGPRRVSQSEIRESFSHDWKINYIKEAGIETTFHDRDGGRGWLSSITRL